MHLAGFFGVRGGEALEVDDEELGRPRDCYALCGFALAAAVRAAPDFVAGEHFRRAVAAKAVGKGDRFGAVFGLRDFNGDAVEGLVGCGGVVAGCAL